MALSWFWDIVRNILLWIYGIMGYICFGIASGARTVLLYNGFWFALGYRDWPTLL